MLLKYLKCFLFFATLSLNLYTQEVVFEVYHHPNLPRNL